MRSALPLIVGLALVLAVATPARAAERPLLAVTLLTCTSGPAPADRAASFTASLPAADPQGRAQLRYTLLQRRGARGAFRPVDVPGWGVWEKAAPGRAGLVSTKRVAGLLAPAGYRARVAFRWYGHDGRLRRQVTRTTPVCEQPDPRADLAFGALTAVDQGADVAYVVAVENAGRAPAPATTLTLAVDGVVLGPTAVGPLAPGDRASVTVTGPRCTPGGTVVVTLDAGGAVDEPDERGDVVERPCPL